MSISSAAPATCSLSPHLRSRVIVSAVAVLVVVLSADAKAERPKGDTPAKDSQTDVKVIKDLIAKYAKSVDDADTTLAAKVWSNSADVSFIHPRGHERGW